MALPITINQEYLPGPSQDKYLEAHAHSKPAFSSIDMPVMASIIQTCRRTFGQKDVDSGVLIDAMSRMMGHVSTKTIEKYYCRKTQESAIQQAQQVWGNSPKPQGIARHMEPKTP